MKKALMMTVCIGALFFTVPVAAEQETTIIEEENYSFQIPTYWKEDAPYYYKGESSIPKLFVTEIQEPESFEDFIAMGDEYVSNFIMGVDSPEVLIPLHETTYSDLPAIETWVFGQIDGTPCIVQNDVFKNPSGRFVSLSYYYNDDNRDYYSILDSLVFNDTSESEMEMASEGEASAEPTMGEKNALRSAENYLDFMAFSYSGLIEQLQYEGYSVEEATYAADNCGADWYEQAAKTAESYLDFMSFSRAGLIEQLVYEGYTQEQAEYGADAVGY